MIGMNITGGLEIQQQPLFNKPFTASHTPSMENPMFGGSCLRFSTSNRFNLKLSESLSLLSFMSISLLLDLISIVKTSLPLVQS